MIFILAITIIVLFILFIPIITFINTMKTEDEYPCLMDECPKANNCKRIEYKKNFDKNHINDKNSINSYFAVFKLGNPKNMKECEFYKPIK